MRPIGDAEDGRPAWRTRPCSPGRGGPGDQRDVLAREDLVAAGILIGAVIIVLLYAVKAERTSLEDVATPLSKAEGASAAPAPV
jgi:hypothetical protein